MALVDLKRQIPGFRWREMPSHPHAFPIPHFGLCTCCLSAVFYLIVSGVSTAAMNIPAPAHDPFEGADDVLRLSFEPDEDLDHDRFPDDWSRRKGPGFPSYVDARIDRERGQSGRQSLRFDVNGGPVALYSDPRPIDHLHAYVFEGYIRTQLLEHDAALLSVSFLNHRRQRVQRFLSAPVSGTHRGWVRVRLGPMHPKDEVRFVVVGCHLIEGQAPDIRGAAWFDNLWLGRLPQLKLLSNFDVHFKQRDVPIVVTSTVTGLDGARDYELQLRLLDSRRQVIAQTSRRLSADDHPAVSASGGPQSAQDRPPEVWTIDPQDYGYYQIRSTLLRDNVVILDQETSVAVMDLVQPRPQGEFGWTIAREVEEMPIPDVASVAAQAGINWLKYPLWQSAQADGTQRSASTAEMLEELERAGITPVGLLNQPPPEIRSKFASDWTGISEIFTMPPSFWAAALDRVIARYSSNVRHWQLGDEADSSFVGLKRLGATLAQVKSSFDRIGRDTHIGVPWDFHAELPPKTDLPRSFFSIGTRRGPRMPHGHLSAEQLRQKLAETGSCGVPRWVLLRPLPKSQFTQEERGTDLVQRMVAARIGGAEAIFADDVFDEETGLLNADGSPTLLFLPWRSTALALQHAEFLGSLDMPGGSTNYAFARDGQVVLVVWNAEPTTEELYLGEDVTAIDIWGRRMQIPRSAGAGAQRFEVGPVPLILRGCSEPIARWRLAVQFEKGRLRSETAEQPEAILGRNTFSQGVSGQVTLNLPHEWKADRSTWPLTIGAGETFALPMLIELPANASLGLDQLSIDFELSADRPYQFRVHRPYQVGLGDVSLQVVDSKDQDGRLRIEQIITNRTSPVQVLNFSCSLFVPGQRRQKKLVVKLAEGEDHQFYFVPDAEKLRGQELWLRAEQIDGPQVLNFKWTVGQTWEEPPTPKASPR